MAFTVRTAAEIRDEALTNLRTRYLAAGADIDIQEGSPAYNEFDAWALELEAVELGAREAAHRVLVRETFGSDLDLFAEDLGTARFTASSARRYVLVTGANSTLYTLTGQTLNDASGVAFLPIDTNGAALGSVTTDGSGNATVLTEAQTDGTGGNVEVGTILTWSSAPSGMGATGTVASDTGSAREGENAETDEDLQTRLLELLRERPASGNRADWRARGLEIRGVEDVYVYPLLAPPASAPGSGTPHTPGCVTVVLLGPAQGDSVTNTRRIGGTAGAALPTRKGYFEGTHDADQNPLAASAADFAQWRPVGMEEADYTVEAANEQTQSVTAQLVLDASASWSWETGALTASSSTTTSITVSGDHSDKAGLDALVFIGTSNTRGGWTKVTIATVGVVGPNSTLNWTPALAAAPTVAKNVYAAPSNWEALRLAAFAHMDALGPGDVDLVTYPRSGRFPPESWGARAKFYRFRFAADLMAVAGVLTAEITSPLADVTPAQKTVVVLDEFLVTP